MSWDDGKHTKVKRVQLTFDDVIRSIEVEYNGASVKSQPRGTVGTKSDGFTLSPDEYITEVNGYYKTVFSGDVITALTFKTNTKTYGTYGNKTRFYFSLNAPKDNQIAGFFGSSSNALNSIDAHFGPLPPPDSTGNNPGTDDTGTNPGGNNSGTDGTEGNNDGDTGTNPGTVDTETNNSGGNNSGSDDTGGNNDGGTGTNTGSGSNTDSSPQKVEAQGGKGGNQWDDGVFDGVKKIIVGKGSLCVTYINIEYEKDGNFQTREHGKTPVTAVNKEEFSVDYPNEYITGVGGSYDSVNYYGNRMVLITSLIFKTSYGRSSPLFGVRQPAGTEFMLESKSGGKLVGFHGRSGEALDAIGPYFSISSPEPAPAPSPAPAVDTETNTGSGSNTDSSPQKVEAQGGKGGNQWDDGADQDGVTKIHVTYGLGIEQIRFDYVKSGQPKEGAFHGLRGNRSFTYTIEVNHPDEYLLSVKGCYDSSNIIQGIQFKTNTKTSDYFGYDDGTQFSLEVKDKKIIGFHGFADTHLNSLGAYFAPTTN